MIVSFRDRNTERLWAGEFVKAFEPFREQAEKRLRILECAGSLFVLRALRSNRLENLKGDRKGQYSIRINDQWRICFEWPDEDMGPSKVEIVDYH
jgi:proteic killer suppression protein